MLLVIGSKVHNVNEEIADTMLKEAKKAMKQKYVYFIYAIKIIKHKSSMIEMRRDGFKDLDSLLNEIQYYENNIENIKVYHSLEKEV